MFWIRIAEAADSEHITKANEFVKRVQDAILFPLMAFLLSLAFLLFLWGAYQFVANAESDEGRETGRKHMMWGIAGMFIMLFGYTLLKIVAWSILGCDVETPGGCGTL